MLSLDGPVLVFGRCYSNLEATVALRREAERLGIPPTTRSAPATSWPTAPILSRRSTWCVTGACTS